MEIYTCNIYLPYKQNIYFNTLYQAERKQYMYLRVMIYVCSGYTNIARLLIDKGAEIDTQNIHGASPLHACAIKGHGDIMQVNR